MASIKSHLFAFLLKYTRKRSFASVEGMHKRLKAARQSEDHSPPAGLDGQLDIDQRDVDGMPVYELRPIGGTSGPRIVYMHGGAYLFEITEHHWKLIAEIAGRLGAHVTVPIYPLAPETKALRILGAGMSLYRDVLSGTPAERVVFMGDSAGGNMAVVLSMMAAEEGLAQPSAMVLISPALDLTISNPAIAQVEKTDPWLGVPGGLEATRLYAGDMDFADWRISPLYGDLSVLPRSLLLTGTRDILNPDARIFVGKARELGVDIEMIEAQGMFHVWPLLDMREGHEARDRIVAFLERAAPVEAPAPVAAAQS